MIGTEWVLVNMIAIAIAVFLVGKAYWMSNRRGTIILKQSAQIRLYCDLQTRILRDYEALTNIKNFDTALARALLDLPETDYFQVLDLLDAIGDNFRKLCDNPPLIYTTQPSKGERV